MFNARLSCPPRSQIGAITPEQRQQIIRQSALAGHYEKAIDRESAYEVLKGRTAQEEQAAQEQAKADKTPRIPPSPVARPTEPRPTRQPVRQTDDFLTAFMKSAGRAVASQAGRDITRGILGSLLGGKKR